MRQGESKIPLCNPSGGKLLLKPSSSYNKLLVRVAFRILSNIHDGALLGKLALTISTNKLHRRCSTGFRICLWLKVLSLWGVDRLQVYGICSHRPDVSTWENCLPWDFDYNNIKNTNTFGGAIENSLTSKLLLFTPELTLDE